ncbi:alpha/beta hydrolase [Nocardia niigatensis]|uniref:alpha/beta hydrolase n=1 Tax=Nocardia niigatensis TaxID=209249 RepID=UPI0007C43DEC|nr:alpha/beta hydrolase [Nocardia niigatensis]
MATRVSAERGSWQARSVRRLSALTVRGLAAHLPVNARTLPPIRVLIDHALRTAAPTLRGTEIEQVRQTRVRGEWVRGPKAERTDRAVLYVHGGGFVAGSAAGYRGVASRFSTATRMPVFAVDYRRAPEHPFPAAPQDVSAAFQWLLAQGFAADRIVVAGDSAGGYLAADLVIANAGAGRPQPGALVLFSPMADLTLEVAAGHEGAAAEGLLSIEVSRRAVALFTGTPLELRPVRGMRLPPTLIHTSDTEFFGGDAIALARRWTDAGAVCELQVWPDQMHVFQALPALIPESRFAYRAAARFVSSMLDPAAAAV